MQKSVYLDSTILSFYYDDRPASIRRQKITVDWWKTQRKYYDIFTSFFVLKEIDNPVYPNWEKVVALAEQVPVLEDIPEIRGIVKVYLENKLMPADDFGDAAHLAIASFYSIDFLLTWNCNNLANANKRTHQKNQHAFGTSQSGSDNTGTTLYGGNIMIRDEVIEEMRERRRKLMKEKYGNSLDRLFDDADKWQKQHPERIVHPERTVTLKKAS